MLARMSTDASPSLSPFEVALAKQVRAEAAAQGLELRELAERAGVSVRAQVRYLDGERTMSVGLVLRYATALGLDIDTLMRRARDREE